jgi:DedD protein
MERNRVLWVIFSISLFLVVVLGVGLYLLRPVPEKRPQVAAQVPPRAGGFDAFEYVRGKTELPAVEEPKKPEETVIVVGEKGQPPAGKPEEKAVGPAAALPVLPVQRPAAAPAAPKVAAPPPPATLKTARPTAAPAKPRAAAAPRGAKTVKVNEYWIQVASASSLSRAEEAARSLTEQGLAPLVTTREMSGKTYYRVRVGPYPTESEAEKFLEWIRNLKGYETSYISMVTARRPSR